MFALLIDRPLLKFCGVFCLAVVTHAACREASTPKAGAAGAPSPSGEPPHEAAASAGSDASAKTAALENGDPRLQTLIEELSSKWAGVSSARAYITMTAIDRGAGQNLTYGGYGQYACKRIDGKLFVRRDMVNGMLPRPGQPLSERNSTIITGPEITYFFGEDAGKLFAQKRRSDVDEIVRLGGRTLLNQLKRLYTLRAMPDSEIDGQAVHVIAATPPSRRGRVTFAFSIDSGAMVQMKMETDTGESSRVVAYSNIELNPDLDNALFEFHPPPGVDLLDLTKLARPR